MVDKAEISRDRGLFGNEGCGDFQHLASERRRGDAQYGPAKRALDQRSATAHHRTVNRKRAEGVGALANHHRAELEHGKIARPGYLVEKGEHWRKRSLT